MCAWGGFGLVQSAAVALAVEAAVRKGWPDATLSQSPRWTLAFEDSLSVVFVRAAN